MEEENDSIDINYKKDFNHGYWLAQDDAKYLDELLNSLGNKDTSYYKALVSGKEQWERENFLEQIKNKSQDKEIDR